ncbi:3,9-dihydroxypterocarpan 6A-monooxygenase-like [Tasmannia lanceolata]|uniref:3,9-dihydroxypterocarpan 6A-monooxygenase-like n=1 Tax=Tasmannia lanceolata TaxID=3420 RepID=UPI0040640E0C
MATLQDYTLLFLILLISSLLLRTIFSKFRTTRNLPPSPFALPIIGHLHLLAPIPHQALHKLSTRYGPLISLRLGSVPCIVSSSPETAKEFLKTHELSFASRPVSAAIDIITYGSNDFSFAPYGPYWKFMKKLCMSELLGGRILDQFSPVRREEIQSLLLSLSKKSNVGEKVDVGKELVTLTNNIISRMAMGRRCIGSEEEAEGVQELVQEVAHLTGKFNFADFIGFCKNFDLQGLEKRYKDVHKRFDEMMEGIMREHEEARKEEKEEGEGVKDLLDILLEISDDENAEVKLTRENIKAFILDIFVAGTDTSAITTEWTLAELINHPPIMKKLREEIDSMVGKTRVVEESDIPNLPYLQAIVKETLRLHPTGPLILRESTQDCEIGGYDIPAYTRLFINVWAIGRDPDHWENPLEFSPERFISGGSSVDVRGQHFHLLPFGSGRRGCPGTSLALQVVQATVAAMVQCFDLKVGNGGENGKVDMTEGLGLTLPRAKPLVCVPVARLGLLP